MLQIHSPGAALELLCDDTYNCAFPWIPFNAIRLFSLLPTQQSLDTDNMYTHGRYIMHAGTSVVFDEHSKAVKSQQCDLKGKHMWCLHRILVY